MSLELVAPEQSSRTARSGLPSRSAQETFPIHTVTAFTGQREDRVPAVGREADVDLIALGWSGSLAPDRAPVVQAALESAHVPSCSCQSNLSRGGVIHKAAIVARLKSGAEEEAAELLAQGPPFDPEERGLNRHAAYLSAGEVVFVFEGPEVDVALDDLVGYPLGRPLRAALDRWRPLIEGHPRIARPAYEWERAR